jgi:hypothetical protein
MLWAPTAAFACGGSNPSAVNVYVECVQSGGGSKPSQHVSSGGTRPTTPVTTAPTTKTARVLAHVSGPDKALLSNLASDQGLGPSDMQSTGPATAPSAIGSAFDLGSGPTALLVILAGTAVVLLGGSGLRFWRRRHQV